MKTYFYELRETQPEALFQVSKISSANFSRMKNSHKHSHYEIGCVVDRNNKDLLFETYIENYKYMTPNFAFTFIPPNVRHKGTKEKSFYERLLITVRHEFIAPIAEFVGIDIEEMFSHPVCVYSEAQIDEIFSVADEMIIEKNKNPDILNNIPLKLLFAKVLYLLTMPKRIVPPGINDEMKIISVIDHIKNNYYEDLTLENLSVLFYMSKFEICRKIKSITGHTFSNFLTLLRINHARDLLENSKFTINEVSAKTGYKSPAYFSLSFKKNVGISPTEYRKLHTKNS